jgi:anti-anti-sigma factor
MTTAALLRSIERNKARFVALSYRLQEERLDFSYLVTRFLPTACQNGLTLDFTPPPIPLWRFARTKGIRQVCPLPTIRGGEGLTGGQSFRCRPQHLNGSVACLSLSGELDLATVATFRAHLSAVHDAAGLILDLRDLRYIDSSGINTLLDIHRAFAPSRRRIALFGASPNVRRILSVLHLEDLMPVFVTLDEALGHLRLSGKSAVP